MTRSLGMGEELGPDPIFNHVPASSSHLREPLQTMDAAATVYVDHDIYVPYVKDGKEVMTLLWVKGEYITPTEALRLHYNEPTRMQLLEAEREEMKDAHQLGEQVDGVEGAEQGREP